MPMASKSSTMKSGTSTRSTLAEDSGCSGASYRESSNRSERHPTRKNTMDEGSGQSAAAANKDFNRGEMRTMENSGGGAEAEKVEDNKSSRTRRSDKEKSGPHAPQDSNDRVSSSARASSNSPTKRKAVPPETHFQEPPRPLIIDLNEPNTDSSGSSVDDSSSENFHRPGSVHQEIDMDAEFAAANAVTEATRTSILEDEEKLKRDFEVARELDRELNAQMMQNEGMPGDFPNPGDSAHAQIVSHRQVQQQHLQQSSATGRLISAGGLWGSSVERQLEKAKEKIMLYKKKLEEMEIAAAHWQRQAHQENVMHNKMYNQARGLDMEVRSAAKHINNLEMEVKTVKHELNAVKQQLSDAVNLSEVRGKELKGAQVFLTKADTLSITDVAQKVNALNEEIFQMAAFLGEVLVYEELQEGAESQRVFDSAVFARATQMLGHTLASALTQDSGPEPKEPNPLLVQIVMQIALTQWCAFLGSRWSSYHRVEEAREGEETSSMIAKQEEHNSLLTDLYNSIRDHEDQAVAGRWRSLTKSHLPFSTAGWDHSLMLGILSVMNVAGWTTRAEDEAGQIEKRLGAIFKPLMDLRKATGEDVTSADLEIATIDPGLPFDPAYMEDAYADGRSSSKNKKSAPEAVVSTSGLGLKRIVVKRLKGGGVQRQAMVLAMPKVVLEKTIKEALEPPAPTRKKKKAPVPEGGGGFMGISLNMGF